jgi:hypothetical protein
MGRLFAMVGLVLVVVVGVASAAHAGECPDSGHAGVEVCGSAQERGSPAADPAVSAGSGSRGLALTGGDVAGLVVIGAAAVGTGAVLVRTSRRRSPAL